MVTGGAASCRSRTVDEHPIQLKGRAPLRLRVGACSSPCMHAYPHACISLSCRQIQTFKSLNRLASGAALRPPLVTGSRPCMRSNLEVAQPSGWDSLGATLAAGSHACTRPQSLVSRCCRAAAIVLEAAPAQLVQAQTAFLLVLLVAGGRAGTQSLSLLVGAAGHPSECLRCPCPLQARQGVHLDLVQLVHTRPGREGGQPAQGIDSGSTLNPLELSAGQKRIVV